jgi:serine/threonine protein kinase
MQVRGKLSKDKTLEKLARECDILERLQGCPGIIQVRQHSQLVMGTANCHMELCMAPSVLTQVGLHLLTRHPLPPLPLQLEDVFEDAQNVMIVTEYCSGGDLQKFAEVGRDDLGLRVHPGRQRAGAHCCLASRVGLQVREETTCLWLPFAGPWGP